MKKPDNRRPVVCFAIFAAVMALASVAVADRNPLSDADLDRVSAAGFEGFDLGLPSVTTNLSTPILITNDDLDVDADTELKIYNFLTNINTALNVCVLANCINSGANIANNSNLLNDIDMTTQIVPTQINTHTVESTAQTTNFAPPAAPLPPSNLGRPKLHVPAVTVELQ